MIDLDACVIPLHTNPKDDVIKKKLQHILLGFESKYLKHRFIRMLNN